MDLSRESSQAIVECQLSSWEQSRFGDRRSQVYSGVGVKKVRCCEMTLKRYDGEFWFKATEVSMLTL